MTDQSTLAQDCWIWKGTRDRNGYGRARQGRVPSRLAHRVIFELFCGPIPAGLQLDHLCRQRGCVNPHHLRICTAKENSLAPGSRGISAVHSARTHCVNGHRLVVEGNRRRCRVCDKGRIR